ncbi:GDP-L-fucose synthase family protein [Bradyrhizobium vignae]|uniref:GDP-L-fucose synthase family protein n=1 Tax=Bradyrhizobium vignae TaxID=1549949 RepID=UPI00100B0D54|nr:GDP-L-fucose synthase [Bradyrhizobium vignae]RXG85995.1 GDP-L-fucose synthase [Bradyrhizobium vignae]
MTGASTYDLTGKRVFVAGHRGMVGSAVVRRLASENCTVLTADRRELDLTKEEPTLRWLEANRPDVVVHAAAKVGGIAANNNFPVDFLCDNLALELSVIRASHAVGVRRLLFLGSSCIYPKHAKQPMAESELLTGPLEPTNEWYAIAKIAGLKMCQAYRRQYGDDFISVMPTNLYGRGDNYHPDHSHVPAALIRRFHEAKLANAPSVSVWGTGTPLREFLNVEDLADACVFLLKHYSSDQPINVGSGDEVSIAEFAMTIAEVVGYEGSLIFDTSKPDGAPRKLLDSSRIQVLGWRATTSLREGLASAFEDFLQGHGRHFTVSRAS